MAWVKIATGTKPDNVQMVTAIRDLPKGTKFRYDIVTDWLPFGPLADLAGAEFAVELLGYGGDVIDVSGPSWNKVRIDCVSDPISVVGVVLALAALGVWAYMITKIDIFANIAEAFPEAMKWTTYAVAGVMGICGIYLLYTLTRRPT